MPSKTTNPASRAMADSPMKRCVFQKSRFVRMVVTMNTKCCVFCVFLTMWIGVVSSAVSSDRNIRRRLQGCATPPTSLPVNIVSEHSGLSLRANVDGKVVQSFASSDRNDNWLFESAGGGLFRLVIEGTNLAMSVAGGAFANGVLVEVTTGNFTDGRDKWCLTATGSGIYQLVNAKTLKLVDIANYSKSDGSKIHQWANHGGLNQQWRLSTDTGSDAPGWKCATFGSSAYHIIATHSGMALSVDGVASGATVRQSPATSALNDNWSFVSTSNGFYHVIAQHSGLAMAVTGDQYGAMVIQKAPTQSFDDDWCFVPAGTNIYEIRNRQSAKSLDVANKSLLGGGIVHQWSYWGGAHQKFAVQLAGTSSPIPPVTKAPQPPPLTKAPTPSPTAPTPPASSPTHSSWLPAVRTPVIAVAASHLPDGQILMWSSSFRNFYGMDRSNQTWTSIYNPATGGMTEQLVNSTYHDMFCPGTTVLPNGVIMISGGSNSKATTFYDYRDNQWSVGPEMKLPRGYQAHTLLATGEVFSFGGSWSGGGGDKDGEVWSPQTNSWRLLTGVPSAPAHTADIGGRYRSDNHYWVFVAPNGKVFHAGPSKQMHWITTAGNGSLHPSILRGDDDDAMNGNAVMYDIGKILTVGGAQNYDGGAASNRAYIIDVNGSEAVVKRTRNDMQFGRALVNSVVLPNGEVVVIGGMTSVKLFSDETAVMEAEIWSPITETFRTLKPMRIPRTYHAVALILKDGRVWAAGGGLCDGCSVNHRDFEILTPPYMFNVDGSLATRPTIQSSPATAVAGEIIVVTMNSGGSHTFALIKASAVTHSLNNDQRRLPLDVMSNTGTSFSLKIPVNKNIALPGIYFLFAMNANGVPSVGETIRIE